jgi:hypothetical protein
MTAPNREVLKNNTASTLNGGINNSTTSITVTNGAVFPSVGNFRIIIDDEIILVTARATHVLTVVRGAEGTAAASHSDSAVVTHILTADALERMGKDNVPLWGSPPPLNKLVAADGVTLLTSADFTWTNQGGATLTDHNGSLTLRVPQGSGANFRIARRAAPTPPYSLTVGFQCFCPRDTSANNGSPLLGLAWRQSTSGKFHSFGFNSQATSVMRLVSEDWTDEATYAGTSRLLLSHSIWMQSVQWVKLEDDNTDLKYYVSPDGIEWVQLLSHARDAFLTTNGGVTGPDQIGITITNNPSVSTFDALLRLLHWHSE